MKIEWTDAACKMIVQRYRHHHVNLDDGNGSETTLIDCARELLNAATAEQFRPETAEEKCKRYEAVLINFKNCASDDSIRIIAAEALAGPNSK